MDNTTDVVQKRSFLAQTPENGVSVHGGMIRAACIDNRLFLPLLVFEEKEEEEKEDEEEEEEEEEEERLFGKINVH